MKITPIFLLLTAVAAVAVEPNFVRTTVYTVGKDGSGNDADLVSTTYSDGLGRQIQSKVKVSATQDRTACTFYDDAGRPEFSTKTFINSGTYAGVYLPGDLATLNGTGGALRDQYSTDTKPYSYTKYSDDPLSRVIEQNGPGAAYTANAVKTWYFGVADEETARPIAFSYISGGTSHSGTITFANGLITSSMTAEDFDDQLTGLATHLLMHEPFNCTGCPGAQYFLTVSKDPMNQYTQELKDLFGKTIKTWADPSISADDEIIAQYSYDILGNLIRETPPGGGVIGNSEYIYNTIGQLIHKRTPDGGRFGYAYTLTGQLEYDTSYCFKSAQRFVNRIRKYEYDELDRLARIGIYEDSRLWYKQQNFYDDIQEIKLNASTYTIQEWELLKLENLNGRLVASVATNKVNTIFYHVTDLFSYDDEGRIKLKIKLVPGLPHQYISYTYDIHGKVLTETTQCGGEEVVKQYNYDPEGRLKNVVHVNNGNKVLALYNYDNLGRVQNKTLGIGSGHQIDYLYNIREWTTDIKKPTDANYPNAFEEFIPPAMYAANGNIKQAQYKYTSTQLAEPFLADLTYAYDDVNRLKTVLQSGGAATTFGASYNYDAVGRLTKKFEGEDESKTGYIYFSQTNRLKNPIGSNALHYFYDKHGNMVVDVNKKMVIEYDWRDMPVVFRFYNSVPTTFPCDGEGTLDDDPKWYVEQNGGTLVSQVVMLYDASGNRVLKMEGK